MKYEEVKAIMAKAIENKEGGTYVTILKNKDFGNGYYKRSVLNMRIGVNYGNMKINEGKKTGELPWGKWVEGFAPYLIEHTKKGETELRHYLRISSKTPDNPDGNTDTIETKYFFNGVEITKEEMMSAVGERKMKSDFSPVYAVDCENILEIHRSWKKH